mmetsp:Transcript_24111/g.50275  ORF Transcript_24111/g.50275 Transcript_24111/m.50275 type:complete len:204 (+) Transcript_24111:1905-2516(+)
MGLDCRRCGMSFPNILNLPKRQEPANHRLNLCRRSVPLFLFLAIVNLTANVVATVKALNLKALHLPVSQLLHQLHPPARLLNPPAALYDGSSKVFLLFPDDSPRIANHTQVNPCVLNHHCGPFHLEVLSPGLSGLASPVTPTNPLDVGCGPIFPFDLCLLHPLPHSHSCLHFDNSAVLFQVCLVVSPLLPIKKHRNEFVTEPL